MVGLMEGWGEGSSVVGEEWKALARRRECCTPRAQAGWG